MGARKELPNATREQHLTEGYDVTSEYTLPENWVRNVEAKFSRLGHV